MWAILGLMALKLEPDASYSFTLETPSVMGPERDEGHDVGRLLVSRRVVDHGIPKGRG